MAHRGILKSDGDTKHIFSKYSSFSWPGYAGCANKGNKVMAGAGGFAEAREGFAEGKTGG